MVNFLVQLFPLTLFALIATMIVFLVVKGRASTVVLNVAVVVMGAVVAATYAITLAALGLSVFIAQLYYLVPSVLMLNFALYAAAFNNIIDGLKGKLKLFTATSLASYCAITLTVFFERPIAIWIERAFAFIGWIYTALFLLIAALWIVGAFVAHWWMFICVLRTTREPSKKIWGIIAFCLPIVGSVAYLLMLPIKALTRIKGK